MTVLHAPLIILLTNRSTNVRLYHIDIHTPSISLLSQISIPEITEQISFNFDLLAIPWVEVNTGRLNIHIASLSEDETEKEILVDLGIRDEVRTKTLFLTNVS